MKCRAVLVKVTSLGPMGRNMLQRLWAVSQREYETECQFKALVDLEKISVRETEQDMQYGKLVRTTYHKHPWADLRGRSQDPANYMLGEITSFCIQ